MLQPLLTSFLRFSNCCCHPQNDFCRTSFRLI